MTKDTLNVTKNGLMSMFITLVPIFLVIISIFLIIVSSGVASAVLDCSMCHKTEPGVAVIRAKDTIEINNQTCLRCHSSDYPPTPMGYSTHLAHVGKFSAKVDFLSRHPKAIESFSCSDCHVNIGQNCQNCHRKSIPHISLPLGYNCKGCHGELDNLFRHPTIDLKIHNIFNIGNITDCKMCHNPDNMASLRLANGDAVSIQEPHKLCYQCHSNYYNLWNSGMHYSNKTIPDLYTISSTYGVDVVTQAPAIMGILNDRWQKDNTCVNCHNPHNPSELYQLPVMGPDRTTGVDVIGPNLSYVIALIVIVIVAAILVIKKKKIKPSELKLSGLKLSEIKMPKLKIPKISIPISLSVERSDKSDSVGEVEDRSDNMDTSEIRKMDNAGKQDNAEKLENTEKRNNTEKIITEIVPKAEKKEFLRKYRKDILFVSAICVILGLFYVIFGSFVPMTVVLSESMSPHIEKGDIIFYTDISRIDDIRTYQNGKDYNSFEEYGDVILYKPFGQEDAIPYIHRAMYYVNPDDEMWPGGPKTVYAGYITKGDNVNTNKKYDQQVSISKDTPIKREWIVGVARFRIPYVGYIRMMLPW